MRKPSEIATAFSHRDSLDGHRSFFLVGIGGAGMSALARMLRHRGFCVRGTDSTQSPETDRLEAEGIEVHIGHTGEAITKDDALIVTDAIDLDNSPEVARARELGIPMVRRSQALGWLLKPYKVIAVTGTHGKTTTTGMTGAGLIAAGLDPLVVVGASIPEWGGPVREGKGEWAVVEACEAYDSFHDLDPHIVVLTNLELDHVDFHGSWENLKASVVRFLNRVPQSGALVYCASDQGAADVARELSVRTVAYHHSNGQTMAIPGEHNQLNAQGALAAANLVGVDEQLAIMGVSSFTGAERRLQLLQSEPITVIDDYAHHPTEIEASLQAIRERYLNPSPLYGVEGGGAGVGGSSDIRDPKSAIAASPVTRHPSPAARLIVVYQPHLYSRTEPLIPEFAKALDNADFVVITDIYPAREAPIPGVSSSRIAELLTKPHLYVPSRHLLPRKVAELAQPGDVVVGMGAGNIQEFAPAFIEELKRPSYNPSPVYEVEGRGAGEWGAARATSIPATASLAPTGQNHTAKGVNPGLVPPIEMSPEGATSTEFPDASSPKSETRNPKSEIQSSIVNRQSSICVAYAGDSAEREVSILSGREVQAALQRKGYQTELVDFTELLLAKGDLSKFKGAQRPDLVFLAVHGTHAEDGAIQGLLELLHIPYTGSGIQASAIAMNKDLTKTILGQAGLSTPRGELLTRHGQTTSIQAPAVVKPNQQGSTVGLSFVENQADLQTAITKAFAYDSSVLVEEWVRGMEISVPVLGDKSLLPVEIVPKSGRYDFASKYAPGATEEIVPARLPESTLKKAREIALKAHQTLGCQGATRTDMIVLENGEPVVLEVNTLPGMTSTSLLPNSARAAGIEFDDLVQWIVEDALKRHAAKT